MTMLAKKVQPAKSIQFRATKSAASSLFRGASYGFVYVVIIDTDQAVELLAELIYPAP